MVRTTESLHSSLDELARREPAFARLLAEKGKPDPRRGAQLIVDMVMASPGEITLVPLGPLTNIAIAYALEPRIAQNVREVVLMGGAAGVVGNVSAVAEANIHNDPEAANIVFHAGWPLTMVGLDVTEKTMMDRAYLDALAAACAEVGQWDFQLTIAPLRIQGATGSPVNPIALL